MSTSFARSKGGAWLASNVVTVCPLQPAPQTVPVARSDDDAAYPSATSTPECCTGGQHSDGCH